MSRQRESINKNRQDSGMHGGPMASVFSGAKAKDFKGTMRNMLQYLKPYRVSLILVMVFSIVSTVFSIFGPKILGNATTKLFEGIVGKITGTGTGIDFHYIGNIVLLLIALYIVSAVFSYIQGLIMANVTMKITYDLRKSIAEKINRLPLKFFDTKTHGEVLSRITNDVDTMSNNLNQGMSQTISSFTMIIGVVIMMFTINWAMTLVALVILPISIGLVTLFISRSQKYFKKHQAYLGHVNGHVEEIYAGQNVVKVFNGEEKALRQFDGVNKELYKAAWMSQFYSGMMFPIMNFVGNLGYVGIVILGGFLAINGTIQVGDILAFVQYVRSFTQPVAQTAQAASLLQSMTAAAERVFEFINEPEELQESSHPEFLTKVSGNVTFDSVNFGYSPDKIVIHDFSADIKAGQKVAIVGPTGAGKTTMVKLLMRFYDVNSGVIMVDGVDIRNLRRKDLRNIFGMVLQDTWLFNGTIKQNIRYGNLDAPDKEVYAAAKMAYVDHFVHTLPQGYDMEINEEATNISQGQKQLLTIARAMLANPRVLILDEATSSVDTRTEILIQKAMDDLLKGRTAFIIAHRLSTIRNADIILVMKDGGIVEQGSHNELLAANGFYASMYNSQFETQTVESQ